MGNSCVTGPTTRDAFGGRHQYCQVHPGEYFDLDSARCRIGAGGTECRTGICGGWKNEHAECEKTYEEAMAAGDDVPRSDLDEEVPGWYADG